ncbi:hypothetical protein FJT64_026654 [Amphibalanus amphitrite]|uniref:Reverse transcriptase/retrotransposon-derived protein RNase H-like domain-containing protein n=1 Tax=Amphibalanus amphitrite TaxID=1232801 RepID=A0A6A4WAX8_AMPAM|nr:hypothetical protein FJT64_026654 [Amphibalanus amphitrite]
MLFDPLGIITPFVLIAKCLIQTLWQKKLAWDEDMPEEELVIWKNWLGELSYLEDLAVPRCLKSAVTEEVHTVELHLFADASERAFAAAGVRAVGLTDLTRRHSFEWTEAAERSFQDLRKAVAAFPVVRPPDPEQPFRITTDACSRGWGATLSPV